ncbi:anti-sigma factor [Streptomyces sp. NBC_00669]|uniref:anti-sigma factor n=1 Tax=unclassified Streptomyces TaxID=2593676 RepID=UPI002E318017|nr:anti-sigma factor [Streptomyces sp. NBC_00669]
MTEVDLHTLTGAYAVGALEDREARDFRRHLTRCEACDQEVRELRETAARLALAVAEVPPVGMRGRVLAALPEVRQLPPEPSATQRSLRRNWRRRLPYYALAACLAGAIASAGIAIQAEHTADRQRDRTARAEHQADQLSTLLTAPDASFHTQGLKGGGTATVVSSARAGQAALVYRDLPKLPGSRVYELWFSRNGTMVPAGLVDSATASGSALLKGRTDGADAVGVTAEPHGGSPAPTSAPLAVLPL